MQKKDWHVSVLVIENVFDNYDNYNLNLLLIKRIILRNRKQGSPHAHLMNSNPSQRIENSQDRQESGTCPLILWIQQALSAEFAIHWMSDRTCKSFLSVFQRSLVDLGVDVVTTASTSWVCASDPVTRYLSHNSTSHPAKNAKVCKSFSPVLPGWGQEDRVYPGRRFTEKSVFLPSNYLHFPYAH